MAGRRSASRGKPRSSVDKAPSARPSYDNLLREELAKRFWKRANTQHPFKGNGTQCQWCWGWIDDSRHL